MSYLGEVLADSPARGWLFNEVSGTGVVPQVGDSIIATGTYTGSPTLGGPALIATGSAAETVATSYISLPTPLSDIGVAFSVELWFQYVSGTAPIFRDNRTSGGWYLDVSGTNPVVGLGLDIDDQPLSHTITAVTSASLKSGRQHFVLTGDGSRFTAYVGGVAVDSWFGGLNQPFAYTFLLGKDGANSGHVRAKYAALFFYRKALYPARIAAHYAAADGYLAGPARITAAAKPLPRHTPGTAPITVTARPLVITAPVVTRSAIVLTSATTDDTTEPLDSPTLTVEPLHIVAPAIPVPTLVDGRPQ